MSKIAAVYGDNKFWPGRRDEIDLSAFDQNARGIGQEGAFRVRIVTPPAVAPGQAGHRKIDISPGQVLYAQPGHYSSFTLRYADGTEERVQPEELVQKFPILRRHWNRFKQRTYPRAKEAVQKLLR